MRTLLRQPSGSADSIDQQWPSPIQEWLLCDSSTGERLGLALGQGGTWVFATPDMDIYWLEHVVDRDMGRPRFKSFGLSSGCAFTQEAGVAHLFRQGQLVAPAGAPADALPIDTAEPDTARIDDVVPVAVETRGVFTVGSPAPSWTATAGDCARWPSRPGKVLQSSVVQAGWPQVEEDVEGSMLNSAPHAAGDIFCMIRGRLGKWLACLRGDVGVPILAAVAYEWDQRAQ